MRVFTKTMKEYQNILTKADIIKNQLSTFVFRNQRKNKPDIFWCRPSSAVVSTIVSKCVDHRRKLCPPSSAAKQILTKHKKQKNMGKIKYDFYKNPDNKEGKLKSEYHIRVCGQQTISTKGIIELIHNASTLTPADINAVIFAFQDEIANQLAKGNIVKLEGLCNFNISLKSANGTCTGKENGKGIVVKSVNINPEKEFTERVKKLAAENGMEKVIARHSDTITDEKVDEILTNYFRTNKVITRQRLQDICSTTRYMAMQQIKRLTGSGKLVNVGFRNHPLYMPVPGSFGTKEE